MYASTGASEFDQTAFNARPRPFCSSLTTRTPSSSSASRAAISGVSSMLALSAMVIRTENDSVSAR